MAIDILKTIFHSYMNNNELNLVIHHSYMETTSDNSTFKNKDIKK
jgi:hypothetical protein